MNKTIITISLSVIALVAGMTLYTKYGTQQPESAQSTSQIKSTSIIGQTRPDFRLRDTEDKLRQPSEWDGKVMLVNFWATWCPPCRHEIPAFIELQEKYADKGFVIVGIALDTKQAAVDFVDPMGINYPILIAETEGVSLTLKYGNELGALPFSVIVDKQGKIQKTFRHEVSFEEAEALVSPYLSN